MKKIIIVLSCLFMTKIICFSNELGGGSGSSYPTSLDVDANIETSTTIARADVPNDSNQAIIKIEAELGVNPSEGYSTVLDRLIALMTSTKTLNNLKMSWQQISLSTGIKNDSQLTLFSSMTIVNKVSITSVTSETAYFNNSTLSIMHDANFNYFKDGFNGLNLWNTGDNYFRIGINGANRWYIGDSALRYCMYSDDYFDLGKSDKPCGTIYTRNIDNNVTIQSSATFKTINSSYTTNGDVSALNGRFDRVYGDGSGLTNVASAVVVSSLTQGISLSPMAFKAQVSGTPQIPPETYVKIGFNDEIFDDFNKFDSTGNYRYKPGSPGIYEFSYSVMLTSTGYFSGSRFLIFLYKNGGGDEYREITTGTSNERVSLGGHSIIKVDTEDYFEIYVWQNAGEGVTIESVAGSMKFAATKVR